MSNEMIARLADNGVDTKGTLNRFAGSEELYVKFLNKFLDDETFAGIKPAFDSNDKEMALNTTHTLKGVSGNLGMTRLYEACSKTVELIRADEFDKAKASYKEVEDAYKEICNLIK